MPFPDLRPFRRVVTCAVSLLFATLAGLGGPLGAAEQDRLAFVGVTLDAETREADKRLLDFLMRQAGVSFAPEEQEYGSAINRLVKWSPSQGEYVARITPYVYVVAEMLGAQLEPIATYVGSATGGTTYQSYFVVSKKVFPVKPTPAQILDYLRRQGGKARFVYHNKFSTSSFFLPSLFFRQHNVLHMDEPTGSLAAIKADRIPENSSSKLVELVAAGQADVAAVWDGTRAKFEKAGNATGQAVHFVPLESELPNDLLVCSTSMDPAVRDRIRTAIARMGPAQIGVGDFQTWRDLKDATEARSALGVMRWQALDKPAAATVEVRVKGGNGRESMLLEAVRQAVRLSGTELTLFDPDFHEYVDFQWTVEPVHGGAAILKSTLRGVQVPEQEFRISYRDAEDLTERVVEIIQTRMHRIRHVWSYSGEPPIVLRSSTFEVPPGSVLKVQKISWVDPARNKFRAGQSFDARVQSANYFCLELNAEDFMKAGAGPDSFDALGNTAYRVVLLRNAQELPLFRYLTVAFVLLPVGAAVAAVRGERRHPQAGDPA